MSQFNGPPSFDYAAYRKNRERFGFEELAPYEGQWVAWKLDGTQILAHHIDLMEVDRLLRVAGHDPGAVMIERFGTGAAFEV